MDANFLNLQILDLMAHPMAAVRPILPALCAGEQTAAASVCPADCPPRCLCRALLGFSCCSSLTSVLTSCVQTPRTRSSHARAPGIEDLLATISRSSRVCTVAHPAQFVRVAAPSRLLSVFRRPADSSVGRVRQPRVTRRACSLSSTRTPAPCRSYSQAIPVRARPRSERGTRSHRARSTWWRRRGSVGSMLCGRRPDHRRQPRRWR